MERTTIRWKKIGGGSFRMASGKIIKPGQVFTAREDEIPTAFRNVVVPLDVTLVSPVEAEPEVVKVAKAEYTVVSRKSSKSWFDVVNAEGKVLNEKALKKEQAEELVKTLQ